MSLTTPLRPADFESYDWLRADCEFRMRLALPGYTAREVIPAGHLLYDVQLLAAEPDGSVLMSDIGGQRERGWNPEEGHGAVFRLRPDDTLEPIVPPGNMGRHMPLCPVVAPPDFGDFGGHVFFVGQTIPGRRGATAPHAVFHLAPGADHLEVFAEVPHSGTRGGGVPGAMVTGVFGRPGTEHHGHWFVQSLMNCTVYRVTPDRRVTPYLVLDEPLVPQPIMPMRVAYAPPHWGDLAGELVIGGLRNTHFEKEARPRLDIEYWRLLPAESFDPQALQSRGGKIGGATSAIAPEGFGPVSGDLMWCDEGTTNLMHVTKSPPGPLPYDATIWHMDRDGTVGHFADRIQGGSTSFVFAGTRLLLGVLRKSYSTGDYHEPDSSIYEVRYTG